MRLTQNFRLAEFAVSRTRPDLAEPVPDELGLNVVRLAVHLLQPIRDTDGSVTINSGYRSPRLNESLGGSSTSQHLLAEAVDIVTGDVRRTFEGLMTGRVKVAEGHIGQVILYPHRGFVHIALPSQRFPRPTFCLHWPVRGHHYRVLADAAHLRRLT
jgi:uncharacterized protein YcbK (DUF882 family)